MKRIISIALLCLLLFGVALCEGTSSSGLVPFHDSNKKVGYKDAAGNVVIKPTYLSGQNFYNGYAVVQISKGGYACDQYIDVTGKVVIPSIGNKTTYYGYNEWQGDYGVVTIWDKRKYSVSPIGYNYILPNGKLLNNEIYLYAGNFSEGYALIGISNRGTSSKLTRFSNDKAHWMSSGNGCVADTYYYIDMEGNRLDNSTWSSGGPFKDGYAPVAVKGADGSLVWGLIDTSGKLVASPQWTGINAFYDGLACVKSGDNYGFINTNGELVIPCDFAAAGNFSEGLAWVKVDDKYGFIDQSGELVIPAIFDGSGPFTNGTAIIGSGIAYGTIDTHGSYVIPAAYESLRTIGDSGLYLAKEFTSAMIYNENNELITILLVDGDLPSEADLAAYPNGTECSLVEVINEDMPLDFYCFLDADGNMVSMLISKPEGEKFHISSGSGKSIILDSQGMPLGDGEWDGVKVDASSDDRICVLKNNLYGFINAEGDLVIPPMYTDASRFEGGVATVWIGQNSFVIDKNGKEALPALQKGSKGDAVKKLQQALIDQGYLSGKADGSFGNKTVEAVMAAQAHFGFEQTGIADSDLQNALFAQ